MRRGRRSSFSSFRDAIDSIAIRVVSRRVVSVIDDAVVTTLKVLYFVE